MAQKKTQASSKSYRRVIGAVVNGQFHQNIDPALRDTREHPLHRQYVRDRMREDYLRDLAQPYVHGQANKEYVEAFGREAALDQYGEAETIKAMEE